jgi:hypothetical protein
VGVVLLAWSCVGNVKRRSAAGEPIPAGLLAGYLAVGLVSVAAGLYYLATFLNTPGWTGGWLLLEGALAGCFVLVGVQTVEVVVRSYHARIHGVIRQAETTSETFGEVVLVSAVRLGRGYGLLALGVCGLCLLGWSALESLRAGKAVGVLADRGTAVLFAALFALAVWEGLKHARRRESGGAAKPGAGPTQGPG